MSQTSTKFVVLLLAVLFLISCSEPTPYDHIPHDVRPILEKGIAQSGGLDAWSNAPGYQLKTRSILYLEDGSIESKHSEIIRIINHPTLSGSIIGNNRTDSVSTKIEYKEDIAIKYIDKVAQDAATNDEARGAFLEIRMAMSLPFNLLEPGVKLTYEGEQEQYGKLVKVIVADHKENQTRSHISWHYFDATSYDYLGYKVFNPPTYALVENLQTTIVNGITYPIDRITWRVDSLNNKQYIRSKTAYSDFKSLRE